MQKPTKAALYEKLSAEEQRTQERLRMNAAYVKKCEDKKKESGLKKVSVWTMLTSAEVRELVAANEKKIIKKRKASEGA